eukprot:6461104-Amphidinium_carterae.1
MFHDHIQGRSGLGKCHQDQPGVLDDSSLVKDKTIDDKTPAQWHALFNHNWIRPRLGSVATLHWWSIYLIPSLGASQQGRQ